MSMLPPPLPSANSAAGPSMIVPIPQSPREKMRLAKMALMRDEDLECGEARRKRKIKRQNSVVVGGGGGGGGGSDTEDGGFLARFERRTSQTGSLTPALTSPTSTTNSINRPAPPQGILRRSSVSPALSNPPSSSTSLRPVQSFNEFGQSLQPPLWNNESGPSSACSSLTQRPDQPRRKSSRVRFSEDEMASASTTPPIKESPKLKITSLPLNIKGNHALSSPSPLSLDNNNQSPSLGPPPPIDYTTKPKFGSVSSVNSLATRNSDPLEYYYQAGNISEGTSRMGSGSGNGMEDMFKPQPLPYPRLSQVLKRLTAESTETQSATAPPNAVASSSRLPSMDSIPSSTPSVRSSVASRPSFTSAGSSLLSTRDNSVATTSTDISSIDLPTGSAYAATLLPGRDVRTDKPQVKVNRHDWNGDDSIVSPRSMPTPIPVSDSFMEPTSVPESGEYAGRIASHSNSMEPIRDSIDLLPPAIETPIQSPVRMKMISKHKMEPSDFSDVTFPLPPDRLIVNIAKLPTRTSSTRRKKASLSIAVPSIQAVEEVPEVGILAQEPTFDMESKLFGPIPVRPNKSQRRPSEIMKKPSLSDLVSPEMMKVAFKTQKQGDLDRDREEEAEEEREAEDILPDNVSLTAAVLNVGSPIKDEFGRLSRSMSVDRMSISSVNSMRSLGSLRVKRPESPKLEELIANVMRKQSLFSNPDESDLDTSISLVEAALRSKILSPNSRLLNTPSDKSTPRKTPTRRSSTMSSSDLLKSGMSLTSGKGWSGSESEEEEWTNTVKLISLKRLSSRTAFIQPVASLPEEKPKWLKKQEGERSSKDCRPPSLISSSSTENVNEKKRTGGGGRKSNTKTNSLSSSTGSTDILTPSSPVDVLASEALVRTCSNGSSASNGSSPGRYAWGKSTPGTNYMGARKLSSPSTQSGKSKKEPKSVSKIPRSVSDKIQQTYSPPKIDFSLPIETQKQAKRVSSMVLPKPTRDEDWGEPEILMDEIEPSSSQGNNLLDEEWDELSSNLDSENTFGEGIGRSTSISSAAGRKQFPKASLKDHQFPEEEDTTPQLKSLMRAPSPLLPDLKDVHHSLLLCEEELEKKYKKEELTKIEEDEEAKEEENGVTPLTRLPLSFRLAGLMRERKRSGDNGVIGGLRRKNSAYELSDVDYEKEKEVQEKERKQVKRCSSIPVLSSSNRNSAVYTGVGNYI